MKELTQPISKEQEHLSSSDDSMGLYSQGEKDIYDDNPYDGSDEEDWLNPYSTSHIEFYDKSNGQDCLHPFSCPSSQSLPYGFYPVDEYTESSQHEALFEFESDTDDILDTLSSLGFHREGGVVSNELMSEQDYSCSELGGWSFDAEDDMTLEENTMPLMFFPVSSERSLSS